MSTPDVPQVMRYLISYTAPPSTKQDIITNLRDVLSSLYDNEASARRVAEEAGLNIRTISFGSSASNMWHSIISEAKKQEHLISLVDMVSTGDYKNNPALKDACKAYYDYEAQLRPKNNGLTSTIELKINRRFDEFSSLEKEDFFIALEHLLNVTDEIKIINIRRGSVLARIELPKDDIRRLILLIKAGRLKDLKVAEFNLVGADLSEADLRFVDLSRVDLTNANLTNANLSAANLEKATLRKADLKNAFLEGKIDTQFCCEKE